MTTQKEKEFDKEIGKVISEPAILLGEGVKEIKKIEHSIIKKKPLKAAKEYWNTLGPGLTTGAADDDPSGIATYSQTGAHYGFSLLWLAWFTFPLMALVQEMCARIGLVTGKGLAANIKEHFPRKILIGVTMLLFIANTLNIGADLGAMAQSVQLVIPQANFALLVIVFALIILLLQIYTTYARYAKYLKYMGLALLAYVFSAFIANLNWGEVLRATVIPHMTFAKDEIFLICGILGTTISPYLFFWQTSQEIEERHLREESHKNSLSRAHLPGLNKEIKEMRTDVWSGMFFSNAVMFFIIAACGGVLFKNGITDINTAADAASALRPFAGDFAYFLFAFGVVGIGLLAIPVLAGSSAYAFSEVFNWKQGLYRKLGDATAFYGIIVISMFIGILLNFIGIDPIKMLIYSAVGNGLVAPVVLVFIVAISSRKAIMAQHANNRWVTVLGWMTVGIMALCGGAVIISLFF